MKTLLKYLFPDCNHEWELMEQLTSYDNSLIDINKCGERKST